MVRFFRIVGFVLAALVLSVAAGAGGRYLLLPPGPEPSLARELIEAARFPRVAARLAAAGPSYAAPLPLGGVRGVSMPWRVGIQAGHWKIGELPDEQVRLRGDTGAQWRSLHEVDVNLAVARRVAENLLRAGVDVDLLPATIPVGYDADALIAIHADDGGGTDLRGWKISAPWRASEASRALRDSLSNVYAAVSGLPEDRYGVTYNMLGYYGFSWNRFAHAAAPATPCAIIETGYLTSAADRTVIVDDPERVALAISMGILGFLAQRGSMRPSDLVPVLLPPMVVVTDDAIVRALPRDGERVVTRLAAGTRVRPFGVENGWVNFVVFGNFRVFGWLPESDLR